MTDNELLKYPIGRHNPTAPGVPEEISANIAEIAALPRLLSAVAAGLSPAELNLPYRPGGWMVKQVIHHLADSHMNAYIRCKLAITEDLPTIRPYDEKRWAACTDATSDDVGTSLTLLTALHARWSAFLRGLPMDDFERRIFHPENKQEMSLADIISSYAWHGKHHCAHIRQALDLKNAAL